MVFLRVLRKSKHFKHLLHRFPKTMGAMRGLTLAWASLELLEKVHLFELEHWMEEHHSLIPGLRVLEWAVNLIHLIPH